MEQQRNGNEGPLKSYVPGENALDEIPVSELKNFIDEVRHSVLLLLKQFCECYDACLCFGEQSN